MDLPTLAYSMWRRAAGMADAAFDRRVAELRRFNRFYTQKIGVLEEGLLSSPFSLTEARVLYEIAVADQQTAVRLGKQLGLDRGYLSRILRGFERRGLIRRTPSATDGRVSLLALTAQGRVAFAELDARSRAEIGALLGTLPEHDQTRLSTAVGTIERLLGAQAEGGGGSLLRPHRPGDMGWIIARHGALYAEEYGWDMQFEALVAEIAAKFLHNFNPQRECCWIAERNGENIGSVVLVEETETIAKLRLLLVEPDARGCGIGGRLVQECLRFAREAHYETVTLWTNSVLVAARRLYENAGFQMIEAQPHHSFGHDLVGENWAVALRPEQQA
jgi:DNA-binding MarR family transcriptional regulator/N-acetylglutamate synthase-like GNAT family acetyltransferase